MEERRKRFFCYNNENPIKINNGTQPLRDLIIEDLIFCGGDNNTFNEIWMVELSQTPIEKNKFMRFNKEQNRIIGLFNPKFTYTAFNKDEGSLLLFGDDNKIDVSNCNEVFLYFRNVNDNELIDFKDLNYLIIYSLTY